MAVVGQANKRTGVGDLYFQLVRMSWPTFLACLFAAYMGVVSVLRLLACLLLLLSRYAR